MNTHQKNVKACVPYEIRINRKNTQYRIRFIRDYLTDVVSIQRIEVEHIQVRLHIVVYNMINCGQL